MKCVLLTISTFLCFSCSYAQKDAAREKLSQMELSMHKYAFDIVNAPELVDRLRADSFFTRSLVQALKQPYSFSYRFDSLGSISILYPPDSSFRIFTWQLMRDFTYYRR
jgi:hypothetical protein